MKTYDILIVGKTPSTQQMANQFTEGHKRVAIVELPDQPETYLLRSLQAIDRASGQNSIPPSVDKTSGADHYQGNVQFVSDQTLQVGKETLEASDIILSSGAISHLPAIEGLNSVPYDTPLSFLASSPSKGTLIILGAGPLGVELALQTANDGHTVHLVTKDESVLVREDFGVRTDMAHRLNAAGVIVHYQGEVQKITPNGSRFAVKMSTATISSEIIFDRLIICTGFVPNSETLQLQKGHVYANPAGEIVTNEDSRASRPHVWALGAVTGLENPLVMEPYQADQIAHNIDAPFFDKMKLDPTEPVLFHMVGRAPFARVGMTEKEANEKIKGIRSVEKMGETYLKIVARKQGQILGAHVVGPDALALGFFFEWAIRTEILMTDLTEARYTPPVMPVSLVRDVALEWIRS